MKFAEQKGMVGHGPGDVVDTASEASIDVSPSTVACIA